MKNKLTLILILLGILPSCSSIISKSEYTVAISSEPEGASLTVTNRAGESVHSATTPSTVILRSASGYFKSEQYTIDFNINIDGYSPRIFTLLSSLDGWYFGNLLLDELIGMLVVDPITGAIYNLPERVNVTMDSQASFTNLVKDIKIATIGSFTKKQLERLERLNNIS